MLHCTLLVSCRSSEDLSWSLASPASLSSLRKLRLLKAAAAAQSWLDLGESRATQACRRNLADILSVLAMSAGEGGARESLRFRLEGGGEDVGTWGHEYVRCAQRGEALRLVRHHTLVPLAHEAQWVSKAASCVGFSAVPRLNASANLSCRPECRAR